jgi:hypothetical protein
VEHRKHFRVVGADEIGDGRCEVAHDGIHVWLPLCLPDLAVATTMPAPRAALRGHARCCRRSRVALKHYCRFPH